MHIDAIVVPGDELNQEKINPGLNVVVIDVLRVCTTIVCALDSGARRIYPTLTVQEAFDKKEELIKQGVPREEIVLGGEREGLRLEGFDLGNSPREYTPDRVKGKTLVLSSTNGTKALTRSRDAAGVIIATLRNGAAAANYLFDDGKDIVFHLSGRLGQYSLEDAAGAGLIIYCLGRREKLELSDSARMCLTVYETHARNLLKMFRLTVHGKYLESLGFMEDLVFCAAPSVSFTVPRMNGEGFIAV